MLKNSFVPLSSLKVGDYYCDFDRDCMTVWHLLEGGKTEKFGVIDHPANTVTRCLVPELQAQDKNTRVVQVYFS